MRLPLAFSVRRFFCSYGHHFLLYRGSADYACLAAAECSTSGTTTIIASADATALASCTTYSGSVAIQTSLSTPKDSNGHQQIQIDKLQKIDGNLTITDSTELAQIGFPSLKEVGQLVLGRLSGLASVNMPSLSIVQQMNLTALPVLQAVNFGSVGVTKARSILITNTGLTSLDGFNNLESVDALNINNNQALQNITLKVNNIKISCEIVDNNGLTSGLNVDFPLLQTAQNMTFRNCADIKLPVLQNVTDSLGFYGNGFTSFSAPNLTTCNSLVFYDNPELTNISLSSVKSINATYSIANNTKLTKIDGFQNLAVVGGALNFTGIFTE